MRSARVLSAGLMFSLLSGFVAVLPPLPASAAADPGLSPVAPISSSPVAVQKPSMPKWVAPAVTWPAGGSGETTVGGALARIGGPAAVGGLQVSVAAEASGTESVAAEGLTAAGKPVALEVLPQTAVTALGLKGVVFSAGSAEALGGPVKVSVSYADFGSAYGAGWGGRLRLVSMPACALTTPALPECRAQTVIPGFVNDPVTSTVSAPVALPVLSSSSTAGGVSAQSASAQSEPQVFALTAGASSEAGDFAATTLNQAASWAQGGSSGDFTTSIPVKMPPVAGLSPSVSLNYSSGSVDGLTKSTNNQTSVVGEGWSLGGLSFVERSYRPCKDDGGPAWSGDLCYVSDAPVSIVLNGQSSQLLVDTSGKWFAEDGALGWKVERVTGSPNGVKNGESFKVTTMDGTQYFFGSRDRNAGGGAMHVPVFFHDDNPQVWESCQSTQGFAYSYCPDMGYRWNLDFVSDRFGNTMTYNWGIETSKYGVANNNAAILYDTYARLLQIDFGANSRSGAGASGKVAFTYVYRCFFPAAECETNSDAGHWPDTPWDQFCHWTATDCTGHISPTFWTVVRLEKIETSALSGSTWSLTDQLNLRHIFPATGDYISPAGDDTPPSLWLDTLLRQNNEQVFWAAGVALTNRVFWGDDLARAPMRHYRLSHLFYGSGGVTQISYSTEECNRTNVYDGRADHNVLKCFPAWEDDQFRWYHKYVVTQVSQQDMTASAAPPVVTRYTYQGGATSPQGQEYADAMWRFDENWLVPMSRRTYSKWRGYSLVYTYTGKADGTGLQRQSQDIYFRGMDKDRSGTIWGTRRVDISDGTSTYADHEGLAGKRLRHAEYDATTGIWRDMQITVHTPYAAGSMATNGGNPPTISAWKALPTQTKTLLYGSAGTLLRTSTVNTSYDATHPLVIKVDDLGETQSNLNPVGTADDKCTATSYVTPDITRWLINFPKETITTDCAGTPVAASYLAGQRFYYDSQALGALGAGSGMGKLTKTTALAKSTAAPPASGDWQTMSQNTVYDTYGRPTTSIDAAARSTVTVFTPAANVAGAVTKVVTTTTGTVPASLSLGNTQTEFDVRFGTPIKVTDVNSKVTQAEYDWHGYLTKVWKNHRAPSATAGITPDAEYRYVIRGDKPSYVGTKLLAPNGTSQLTESISYVDGLMRPRRTETPSADGSGREITDTWYGTTGEVTEELSAWVSGNPNSNFDGWNPDFSYERTKYGYNGIGEQTSVTPYAGANPLGSTWNTTTVTDGRTTTVTPPQGGTVATTITNAQGNTAELRQAKPGGGTLNSTYTYDRLGQLKTVKDSAANTWTYSYDLLGRKTQTVDPDSGTLSVTYTADGLTLSTTDARGKQLWNEYDPLGRRINLHADTASGTVLSSWAYDTAVFTGTSTLVKGQLASTTRFDGATSYKTTAAKYDNAYHPTETTTLAPGFGASGADLTYTSTATFNANGTPATAVAPAAADLQKETLTYSYNSAGRLSSATSKLGTAAATALIASTTYRYTGQVDTQILGVAGKQVKTVNGYEIATRRQTASTTSTETATPGTFAAQFAKTYGYDPAGNITSIGEDKPQTSPLQRYQQECFQYDTLRRLTQAWTQTATGACTTPQMTGQATYWRTWTIDDIGNRQTQIAKNSDGTTNTSWTHTNGSAGSVKPHQVKTITATGSQSGTPTRTFGYDAAGNMASRTTNTGAAQILEWDSENHLAKVTENGSTVASYVYNTDGSRLVSAVTSGTVTTTTLYLPDGTELQKTSTGGSVLGQRYLGGVAIRDTTGLKWAISNHQGTGIAQIDSASLTYSLRRTLPYGEALTSPTWTGTKGYVGGTQDTPTGLTHLGAREYDPTIGRFISRDPIMDLTDPQQWNPYTYSNNNPVTWSDPSGKLYDSKENPTGGNAACSTLAECQSLPTTTPYNPAPYKPGTPITGPPTPTSTPTPICPAAPVGGPLDPHLRPVPTGGPADNGGPSLSDVGNWLKDHPGLVHGAINVGVGALAATAAIALCVGTGGLACVVYAAVGVGLLVGVPANFGAAALMGEEMDGWEATALVIDSALSGVGTGAMKFATGKSVGGLIVHHVKSWF